MITIRLLQIFLAAIITERLIDGLHRFYWTRKLKEHFVGSDWGDGIETTDGIIRHDALREYIKCKFCQSWAIAWVVSLVVTTLWSGWSFHWLWMGLVAGLFANKSHDIGELIKEKKYV
jgi:hypothetical protein